MTDNDYTILVIDDSEIYCQAKARLLSKACNCKVAFACDHKTALKIVQKNLIKVILFDWKMPDMNGNDLNKVLRKVDKKYKSILMSGEAPAEIMANTNCDFDVSIVKDKDLHILSLKVMELIHQYDQEFFLSTNETFYIEKIGGFFSQYRVFYSISSIQTIDENYIDEDSWKIRNEILDVIRAGEEKTLTIDNNYNYDFSISNAINSKGTLSSQLGISTKSANSFDTSFISEIEKSLSQSYSMRTSLNEKKEFKRSLPHDCEIQYERFETAIVYKKIRIFITTTFSWSKQKVMDWKDILIPTYKVACRIFQCKRDGDRQIIDCGMVSVTDKEDINP